MIMSYQMGEIAEKLEYAQMEIQLPQDFPYIVVYG